MINGERIQQLNSESAGKDYLIFYFKEVQDNKTASLPEKKLLWINLSSNKEIEIQSVGLLNVQGKSKDKLISLARNLNRIALVFKSENLFYFQNARFLFETASDDLSLGYKTNIYQDS